MSFLVLPHQDNFIPEVFVFAPFPLQFSLNCLVSIEIQGLSSTGCNFQGLSRIFKVRANPVALLRLQQNN